LARHDPRISGWRSEPRPPKSNLRGYTPAVEDSATSKEEKVLPGTSTRVAEQTADYVNAKIQQTTEGNIARYAAAGPEAIRQRLAELDEEWDIERALEVNASVVILTGLTLAVTSDRRWLVVPIVAGAFLLQHALQGWCPPLPLLRRLGIRTSAEIEHERYALKALRGDFQHLDIPGKTNGQLAEQALRAVRT
jgi:hypothetical protein